MEQNYLLTYDRSIRVADVTKIEFKTFAWFETQEEMEDFINKEHVKPIEAFYIKTVEEIEVL